MGVKLAKVHSCVTFLKQISVSQHAICDAPQVPSDMWLYQELLVQLRPSLVVEFGSFQGGSALYFATILSALPPASTHGSASSDPHKFKILTVDIHGHLLHSSVAADARIEAITASSTDASVEQRIRSLRQQCVCNPPPRALFTLLVLLLLQISWPNVCNTGQ